MSNARNLTFVNGSLYYREFELDHYSRDYGECGIEQFYSGMRYSPVRGQTLHTETYNRLEHVLDEIDRLLA